MIELILNYIFLAIFLVIFCKYIDKEQIPKQKKHYEELKQIFKEAIKESVDELRKDDNNE